MNQWTQELVRADQAHRAEGALVGAEARRAARARRLSRKAERAAGRARLALARSL
ncbi:hypothetical protein KUV85_08640 [Nocardioides panacisoli]|uniref:hypothetical protein n=1 Tax=Nocardioides panacisoli TaxID=627624 RepID=UPI001C6334AC|nr:hypothetical protein [Nocardioides panacisoli]QYJ05730.1 hypothetical protein KUV85_08640 [Nocardioides panacisoli]